MKTGMLATLVFLFTATLAPAQELIQLPNGVWVKPHKRINRETSAALMNKTQLAELKRRLARITPTPTPVASGPKVKPKDWRMTNTDPLPSLPYEDNSGKIDMYDVVRQTGQEYEARRQLSIHQEMRVKSGPLARRDDGYIVGTASSLGDSLEVAAAKHAARQGDYRAIDSINDRYLTPEERDRRDQRDQTHALEGINSQLGYINRYGIRLQYGYSYR